MNLFILLFIILVISNLAVFFGKKIKIPSVVTLIFVGVVFGLPWLEKNIIGGAKQLIFDIGDIGLLALMFLAGLESSWHLLCEEKKDAALIAFSSAIIPIFIGFSLFYLIGFSAKVSFIVGVCMSITAEATKAKVLLELKKLKTKMGAALMGSGIIDDAFGLSLFVLLTYFVKAGGDKEKLLVAGSIMIFFVGMIFKKALGRYHDILSIIENSLNWLLVPFFFISIGLHFHFQSLVLNPILLFAILGIAILGKLVGPFLVKPLTSFNRKQTFLIGWAMNSRGALELAIALIAYRTALISVELYSSLIVMAFVTTLMFPFIIIPIIRKDPQIMEED
ncbi:MAG: cation:proton antiporter [Candidatus Omnitrophica bacterium]|nr:cation:proton antiporter [Candidatus Omnitrophota bacterium]MCF7892126.1 cation:proton antiporter [Candidatus Omnitrophota bacterium]MCF7897780.1 cation:proton antiporter [Candidatus Omnitrophota bacterium]MCF7909194.1 cation:proton antiporter [Candidatus Omnitrophota bacterium]